jgi:hypothetical protein
MYSHEQTPFLDNWCWVGLKILQYNKISHRFSLSKWTSNVLLFHHSLVFLNNCVVWNVLPWIFHKEGRTVSDLIWTGLGLTIANLMLSLIVSELNGQVRNIKQFINLRCTKAFWKIMSVSLMPASLPVTYFTHAHARAHTHTHTHTPLLPPWKTKASETYVKHLSNSSNLLFPVFLYVLFSLIYLSESHCLHQHYLATIWRSHLYLYNGNHNTVSKDEIFSCALMYNLKVCCYISKTCLNNWWELWREHSIHPLPYISPVTSPLSLCFLPVSALQDVVTLVWYRWMT